MSLARYAIDELLRHEGKYSNDPNDRGGETYCGITRRFYPNLKLWELLDQGQPEHVLMPHVYKFYEEWWDGVRVNMISDEKLAVEYFLASVNCGKHKAAMMLQRALNLLSRDGKDYAKIKEDGVFGANTNAAMVALVQRRGNGLLRKVFNVQLGMHYIGIMDDDSTQRDFVGWFNRLWSEG